MGTSGISIAVLPFRDLGLGHDPVPPALIEALLEDLTTELARFPSLEVIAYGTALAESQPAEPGESTAMRLRAEYLVQGSVRQAGEALRLSAQLVQQATGRSLWAERFDVPLNDLFIIEDEIVASVANALHVRIEADRLATARRAPIKSLAAYELAPRV
jgi:TolB-like protein